MAYVVTLNPDNSVRFFDSVTNTEINIIEPTFLQDDEKLSVFGNFGKWERTFHEQDFTSVAGLTATTLSGWYDLLIGITSGIPSGLSAVKQLWDINPASPGEVTDSIDIGNNTSVVFFGSSDQDSTFVVQASSDNVTFYNTSATFSMVASPVNTLTQFYYNALNVGMRYVRLQLTVGAPTEMYVYAQSK